MISCYIVGLGNPSMGDDAVGLKIAEAIAQDPGNGDLEVRSLPGSPLDLLQYLEAPIERILIIDTALADKPSGETILISPEQVVSKKELSSFTTHEGDVLKIIDLAKELGQKIPRIRILGIQPEKMSRSLKLSKTLENLLPSYIEMALQVIRADLF